jgi:endonuclease/exonuclease/phosphatase family metal-dependent hydrolase
MRRFLPLLLVLASCGDDTTSAVDAPVADAGIDAPVAVIDAAPVADVVPLADAGPDRDREVWVAAWNLHNFPQDTAQVTAVAGLINGIHPDVLAVIEVTDEAGLTQLVDALPGYAGVLNDDPGAYQRVGLVYDQSRVTVDNTVTLFSDNWSAFPRPPLRARVTVTRGEASIDLELIVVHLKADIDAESQARRQAACVALQTYIADQRAAGGEDFVVLGDWNDDLTDAAADNVFTAFLDLPASYTFLDLAAEQSGEITYIPYARFLDHIMVTTDTAAEVGGAAAAPIRLDETDPDFVDTVSDHLPVLVPMHPEVFE